jgi:hypothetical protein
VTEKYKFVLIKEPLGNREHKLTTLEEGVAEVKQQLEAAQSPNPVTVRRRPIEGKRPDTGTQGFTL